MDEIRIVLAIEPPMFSEALRLRLEDEWGFRVVDEVFDSFDVLLSVAETEADVAVLTVSDTAEIPAIYTHLFAEFPRLSVIGLCLETNDAHVFRGPLDTEQLPDVSAESVVAAIRAADRVA